MVMLSFVFQLHNDINMLPTNDTLFSNSHFFLTLKAMLTYCTQKQPFLFAQEPDQEQTTLQ